MGQKLCEKMVLWGQIRVKEVSRVRDEWHLYHLILHSSLTPGPGPGTEFKWTDAG